MILKNGKIKLISAIIFNILIFQTALLVRAEQCKPNDYVYGENEIIDQLMICSIGKSFDLDLTPQGEYVKTTARALIEQGFSNKTTLLYARLSGLWTTKRASLIETGWKCTSDQTTVNSVIELTGLSLEVVERLEIPLHRNHHKLAIHKPCKTFDLPLWMCRQSKPLYRTTKTWVNRAYFNLTLTQATGSTKPTIEKLALMFTCPETFKQKITHSPSATYILSKYSLSPSNSPHQHNQVNESVKSKSKRSVSIETASISETSITHPASFASTQDGKGPSMPPYHSSVNLIMNQVSEVLRSTLSNCIKLIETDLSLIADYNSFSQYKFRVIPDHEEADLNDGFINKCSSKTWIKRRIELSQAASALESSEQQLVSTLGGNHDKRSQFSKLNYPMDPNLLLDPYGYYHNSNDQMIEDN